MVQRRHDPSDRRVVLAEYARGMQSIARRIVEDRRRWLVEAVNPLTDEEARAYFKGLRLLVECLDGAKEETGHSPHR